MQGKENLYNGFGYLIYGVACSDSLVHQTEIDKLQKTAKELLQQNKFHWAISEGAFYLIFQEELSVQRAIQIGLNIVEDYKQYFTDENYNQLKTILYEIAKIYNSVETTEFEVLQEILEKLQTIKSKKQ